MLGNGEPGSHRPEVFIVSGKIPSLYAESFLGCLFNLRWFFDGQHFEHADRRIEDSSQYLRVSN